MALLNNPQKRSLAIALEQAKEAVRQIKRLNDVSPELEVKLSEINKTVNRAEKEFGLEPIINDPRQGIIGTLSVLWVTLEESRPEKMGRYGAVDPDLSPKLGPKIDRLIELVSEVRKLV